jgi:16S rRNA (cytidine1402-2'-O)-methyltransferase
VADIVARLDAGDDVALVSDAGTPLIADPGARIVAAARAAGHAVVPIPGPSALLAAAVSSGIVPGPFTFVGFLPPKRGARRSALESLRALPHPVICYEAPHRLAAMLADAHDVLGDRPCALCRELTKLHEEVVVSTLGAALEALKTKPARGEYVVIIAEAPVSAPVVAGDDELNALLYSLVASGLSPAAAAKEAAAATGYDRAACYKRAIAVKQMTAG